MKIINYPDSTSYVEEKEFKETVVFKVNSYEDLHHLEQYVDVCNFNGHIPTVVIPNLIDAQADKRFDVNQSSGLKIVGRRLNSLRANFKIFHPHNPEVVEALIDNVRIIDNDEFIREVLQNLVNTGNKNLEDNLILMSSDAGGFKPLMKLSDRLAWKGETFSASKSRKFIDGHSKLIQQIDKQDFEGKDILIIDDICVYGGTFKGLSNLLKERNCGKLYLAVSHMTVQNLGEDPVTNYFDKVYATNSKFDDYGTTGDHIARGMYEIDQPKNLKIIKLF